MIIPKEVSWEEETLEMQVTTQYGEYSVRVLHKWRTIENKKEEVFILPFTNTGEQKGEIITSSKRDAVSSIKRGLNKGVFTPQLDSLIENGKVIKKS
jgi:hypothetical protein